MGHVRQSKGRIASTRQCLLRFLSAITALVGLAMLGYGAYMLDKELKASGHVRHVLSGTVLSVGGTTAILGTTVATCGWRSSCFLAFFLFVYFFLECAELTLAGFFLTKSGREKIIKEADAPEKLKHWIHENAKLSGYFVVGVVAVQLVVMILANMQRVANMGSFTDDSDSEDDLESGRGSVKRGHRPLLSGSHQEQASARYREANADIYEKYGIDRGGSGGRSARSSRR